VSTKVDVSVLVIRLPTINNGGDEISDWRSHRMHAGTAMMRRSSRSCGDDENYSTHDTEADRTWRH
jgi:hypothetical protein